MTTLVINGAAFSQGKRTAERFASDQGMRLVTDDDVLSAAAEKFGWKQDLLEKSVFGKKGFFNFLTRDKERAVACVTVAVAEQLERGDCMLFGFSGLLIPSWITHASRILVTGEKPFRILQATTAHGLSETLALEKINSEDMKASARGQNLFGKTPWDRSLYDLVIHADKIGETGVLDMIRTQLGKLRGISRDIIQKERQDFRLAADVGLALCFSGNIDHVWSEQGRVVVTIRKNVLFQNRLKTKITTVASSVPGVIQVDVRSSQAGEGARTYTREKAEPSKPVLLVDDEKRYVETLSERLKLREVDTRVRYSGEDALSYLDRQESDVMVLDLKMPGIDGFEVLRRIKGTRPQVEVIILTGQGSDVDRKTCLDLGAFAFLERPVDIDVLTETMRRAHEKIRSRKINESSQNIRK